MLYYGAGHICWRPHYKPTRLFRDRMMGSKWQWPNDSGIKWLVPHDEARVMGTSISAFRKHKPSCKFGKSCHSNPAQSMATLDWFWYSICTKQIEVIQLRSFFVSIRSYIVPVLPSEVLFCPNEFMYWNLKHPRHFLGDGLISTSARKISKNFFWALTDFL